MLYFLKYFRNYLLGKHFVLHTDHGSLTWLCNFKDPEGQLACWMEKLQEYDFDIIHRPGCRHGNAMPYQGFHVCSVEGVPMENQWLWQQLQMENQWLC